MKKKILMLPSWYPSESDRIGGSFFQEQACELLPEFDFLVGCIEFKRLNIIKFFLRLVMLRLKPHNGKTKVIQPPKAVSFVGYGLNLRHFSWVIPPAIENLLLIFNEKREVDTYIKLYHYISTAVNFRPDLIYGMTSLINAVPVYALGKKCGLPVVLAEHVPFCINAIPFHRKSKLKYALENADALLTVSFDKSRQILMGNIACDPIVVGNLVNENIFTLKPDRHNEIKNILIVASYNFYKDYGTFLKSMSYLRKIVDIEFSITIVGIAPTGKANEWAQGEEQFINYISKFDILDITKIVGHVPREEIVNYYHSADVFVLTSIQEGLPVSSLEAMACGVPVFATRCGGVEDFIDDSCGRLFQLKDYKAIAIAVKEYLEGKIVFDKQHVRKVVVNRFGTDAFVQRMKSVFNQSMLNHQERACK